MFLHGFTHRTKYDSEFCQLFLKCRTDRNTVDNRINCHPGQPFLFFKRNTQFFKSPPEFRIDLIKTVGFYLLLWCRIINDILVVDWRITDIGPGRLFHFQPVAKGFQSPFQQPGGFILLRRNKTYGVFIQTFRSLICFNISNKTIFILAKNRLFYRT